MSQPMLFDTDTGPGAFGQPRDEPTLPHNGKATSMEAARKAEPRAGTDRARVLAYVRSRGDEGATRDEAAAALSLNPNTLRPRWYELERQGFIEYRGQHRRNAAGNITEVYRST